MNDQSTDTSFEVQSKMENASSLVLNLLLPQIEVAKICDELNHKYREHIYHPMITVWMFISQVLSADHSCQQAVTRFNAYRVAKGLSRVSSETTSYCKSRGRLPEQLFERLLRWTATRCEEATNQACSLLPPEQSSTLPLDRTVENRPGKPRC